MSALIYPTIDELNCPFWDGCRAGELRLQRCACGHLRYPIATLCPVCLSEDYEWETLSGRGEVFSFAVFRHAYNNGWAGRVPYTVAIVQLEEGPRMISNVVGVAPEEVKVGMPVHVLFERETDEVTVPRFEARA